MIVVSSTVSLSSSSPVCLPAFKHDKGILCIFQPVKLPNAILLCLEWLSTRVHLTYTQIICGCNELMVIIPLYCIYRGLLESVRYRKSQLPRCGCHTQISARCISDMRGAWFNVIGCITLIPSAVVWLPNAI